MSKENTRERKLELTFAAHPKAKSFFVTSDDQAFFNEQDALNHGKTLANPNVEEVLRGSVMAGAVPGAAAIPVAAASQPQPGTGEPANPPVAPKAPAKPKTPAKPKAAGKGKAPKAKAVSAPSQPAKAAESKPGAEAGGSETAAKE